MNLRELRESRAYTQLEIAAQCQVAINTVSAWERGLNDPRPPQIRRLAEFYGVPVADIQKAIQESKEDNK